MHRQFYTISTGGGPVGEVGRDGVKGFQRVLWMVREVMRELGEVKELIESESVGSEGSEEDGEGEEELEEQTVDGEGGKESEVEVVREGEAENGGDMEMAE